MRLPSIETTIGPQSWIRIGFKVSTTFCQARSARLTVLVVVREWDPNGSEEGCSMIVIDCECGQQIKADDDEELVTKVTAHIGQDHPDLVGKLSRDDVLAMAHEE
jgi:predicted small metal-binding protein